MSYVDLNPIRAGLAQSLEESDFTSIQQRLEERGAVSMPSPPQPERVTPSSTVPARRPDLVSFAGGHDSRNDEALPVDFEAYVDLLVDTAPAVRAGGEKGPVSQHAADSPPPVRSRSSAFVRLQGRSNRSGAGTHFAREWPPGIVVAGDHFRTVKLGCLNSAAPRPKCSPICFCVRSHTSQVT